MIMSPVSWLSFWGKAGEGDHVHLLAWHCLDVAACASNILERNRDLLQRIALTSCLDEERCGALLLFLISLHDLGKISDTFQALRPDLAHRLQGRELAPAATVRHDALGLLAWQRRVFPWLCRGGWLKLDPSDPMDRDDWSLLLDPWAQAVMGHHGQPAGVSEAGGGVSLRLKRHFTGPALEALDQQAAAMAGLFLDPLADHPLAWSDELEQGMRRASWLVAGLTVLADWLGSDSSHFPATADADLAPDEYWRERALPGARAAVLNAGVLPGEVHPEGGMARIFPHIERPSPLQRFAEQVPLPAGPNLFVLEDATGSGKTEAALVLAHRLMAAGKGSGLYFALPTMATANAMYERVDAMHRSLFRDGAEPSLVLAHGARHLSEAFSRSISPAKGREDWRAGDALEEAGAACTAWLADNRKKALLASVGVGTVDQALLASLPSRHQALRLIGLIRSVLLVDEVHAHDPYMHTLLCTLLRFHAALGGSAVLLSATLPDAMREELVQSFRAGLRCNPSGVSRDDFPLATRVASDGVQEDALASRPGTGREVQVERVDDEAAAMDLLVAAAEDGRCACWVRNSVDDAAEAHAELSRRLQPDRVTLFHARFALGDRLEIEQRVLDTFGPHSGHDQRRGQVLVATQVVEQSLDLDFDLLITDLAPIDLVIQRLGRLRRHPRDEQGDRVDGPDRRGRPCLHLLSPDPVLDAAKEWLAELLPRTGHVYPAHGQLWRTARLLTRPGRLAIPEDSRRLVEGVFGGAGDEEPPEALLAVDLAVEGEHSSWRSLGKYNSLAVQGGYAGDMGGAWLPDTYTPTRMGEQSTTVRLARWDGRQLIPWAGEGRHAWDLSQVQVRSYHVAQAAEDGVVPASAREAAEETMCDGGRWSVLVPMTDQGERWVGEAQDDKGRTVDLAYTAQRGLRVITGGMSRRGGSE